MIRFFSGAGTKNEMFAEYFKHLVSRMKLKYSNKKLVFVLDNLQAHKSSLIWQIVKQDYQNRVTLLYTPPGTPQFSPIENMFGALKRKMKDYNFYTKEQTAKKVATILFSFKEIAMQKFFR